MSRTGGFTRSQKEPITSTKPCVSGLIEREAIPLGALKGVLQDKA
jgi:hypothetical protein